MRDGAGIKHDDHGWEHSELCKCMVALLPSHEGICTIVKKFSMELKFALSIYKISSVIIWKTFKNISRSLVSKIFSYRSYSFWEEIARTLGQEKRGEAENILVHREKELNF